MREKQKLCKGVRDFKTGDFFKSTRCDFSDFSLRVTELQELTHPFVLMRLCVCTAVTFDECQQQEDHLFPLLWETCGWFHSTTWASSYPDRSWLGRGKKIKAQMEHKILHRDAFSVGAALRTAYLLITFVIFCQEAPRCLRFLQAVIDYTFSCR